MAVYYNEMDPFAAAWLRRLVRAGLLPAGAVDERPIQRVTAEDVRDYHTCHWFAGVGGWPHALRLAGLPDDFPCWTGSCPCQPFSAAGRRGGTADRRHLWPDFLRLIGQCRPATVFGEQVAGQPGRRWLARVRTGLEGVGYAVGAADLPAAGVGAPHIRQRLFWGACAVGGSDPGRLGDAQCPRRQGCRPGLYARPGNGAGGQPPAPAGNAGRLADANGDGLRGGGPGAPGREAPGVSGADGQRQRFRPDHGPGGSTVAGFWDAHDLVHCRDDRVRRVEPGARPLVDGFPGRVGRLRGYGNAIVPQAAAVFIRSFLEAIYELESTCPGTNC